MSALVVAAGSVKLTATDVFVRDGDTAYRTEFIFLFAIKKFTKSGYFEEFSKSGDGK